MNTCSIASKRRNIMAGTLTFAATAAAMSVTTAAAADKKKPASGSSNSMGYATAKDGTVIFYKDWGPRDGKPIVFHHGWPLSSGTTRCSSSSRRAIGWLLTPQPRPVRPGQRRA